SGGLGLVAAVTDFAVYSTFVAVNLSVVALRRWAPEAARPFRMPFSIAGVPLTPVLALGAVLVMAAFLRPAAWMLGAAALACGALAYWLFAASNDPGARRPQDVRDGPIR